MGGALVTSVSSSVLVPLRSNASWFKNEGTKDALERRLKTCVLLYDTVSIEDGRYIYVTGSGGAMENYFPELPISERTSIVYHRSGGAYGMSMAPTGETPKPIMGGISRLTFAVDFYPILSAAGLRDADFIHWVFLSETPEIKQAVSRHSFGDRRSPELLALLPDDPHLGPKTLSNFYHDALIAGAAGVSLLVDDQAASIASWKNTQLQSTFEPDPQARAMAQLLSLGFPDLARDSWDEVLAARSSAAGADLRRVVARLSDTAVELIAAGATQTDFDEAVRGLLFQELAKEVLRHAPSTAGFGLNLAANFIPYSGVATTAKDALELFKHNRSWFSFLRGLKTA